MLVDVFMQNLNTLLGILVSAMVLWDRFVKEKR